MDYNDEQKKRLLRFMRGRPRVPRQAYEKLDLLRAALPQDKQEKVHWDLVFAWLKVSAWSERLDEALFDMERRVSAVLGLPISFDDSEPVDDGEDDDDEGWEDFGDFRDFDGRGLRDDVQTLEAEMKRFAEEIAGNPKDQERFDCAREVVKRCRTSGPISQSSEGQALGAAA